MSHVFCSQSLSRPGQARRHSAASALFRGIALVLLTLCCGANVFATDNKEMSVGRPCAFTDTGFDPSTDVHGIEEYQYAIADLLKQEKFAELDCVANSARSSKARFSGGAWKLHNLYLGLEEPKPGHPTEQDWRNHLRRLNQWVAARPNSITAQVALAKSYVNYAWDARGTGYSDTISDSGVKLFHQRLEKAKVILDGASALHNKCPEWYVVMQQVAQGLSWDLPRSTAL